MVDSRLFDAMMNCFIVNRNAVRIPFHTFQESKPFQNNATALWIKARRNYEMQYKILHKKTKKFIKYKIFIPLLIELNKIKIGNLNADQLNHLSTIIKQCADFNIPMNTTDANKKKIYIISCIALVITLTFFILALPPLGIAGAAYFLEAGLVCGIIGGVIIGNEISDHKKGLFFSYSAIQEIKNACLITVSPLATTSPLKI